MSVAPESYRWKVYWSSRYLTVSVLYSKHLAGVLPNDQACNKQIPDLRKNVNSLSSETCYTIHV